MEVSRMSTSLLFLLALIVVCPLMMFFMHRGGHRHGGAAGGHETHGESAGRGGHGCGHSGPDKEDAGRHGDDRVATAEGADRPTVDALRRRRGELDAEIASREFEETTGHDHDAHAAGPFLRH